MAPQNLVHSHFDLKDTMSKIILVAISAIVIILFPLLVFQPSILSPEYVASAKADAPEKIEHILTNMVNDVKSRNFIVSEISIEYFPLGNSYKISVGGVTSNKLLTFGD